MARLPRVAFLIFCLLVAKTCFAAGGSCPSGSSYQALTQCYYVAANGADSNSGTSELSPWEHAPGMPNCTSICASSPIPAGTGIIFRGGDSWHFGNSSASPYTGGEWVWGSSGTSSNPIYIGVDPAWYSGSSWVRPILTGDNPVTTSTTLSSCPYQSGSGNRIFSNGSNNYVILDNFEMSGMCYAANFCSGSQSCPGGPSTTYSKGVYINARDGINDVYSNLYIHGWSHIAFNCTTNSSGYLVGYCFGMVGILGSEGNPQGVPTHNVYVGIVMDGSDSDPAGMQTMYNDAYDIHNSVFRYIVGFVVGGTHTFHDNLVEYIYNPTDGKAHGNVFEAGTANTNIQPVNTYYNNVVRHVCPGNVCGPVNWWLFPTNGTTVYVFNNVFYDIYEANGNYFDIGGHTGESFGSYVVFNNTFEDPPNHNVINCAPIPSTWQNLTIANNHYITDAASPYYSYCAQNETAGSPFTDLLTSHTRAASKNYSATTQYAYYPSTASSPTVAAGTNLTNNFCSTLAAAAGGDTSVTLAANACLSDTTYGVAYNTANNTTSWPARPVNPRPQSSAWDIGAYQFNGTGSSPNPTPNAPTGLTATVQ